jgi:hypothetical protein
MPGAGPDHSAFVGVVVPGTVLAELSSLDVPPVDVSPEPGFDFVAASDDEDFRA